MKKMLLALICTAVVVGLQIPKEKVALAGNLEIKQEFSLVQNLSEEEVSKKPAAEKPVDSTTESTKKKKY